MRAGPRSKYASPRVAAVRCNAPEACGGKGPHLRKRRDQRCQQRQAAVARDARQSGHHGSSQLLHALSGAGPGRQDGSQRLGSHLQHRQGGKGGQKQGRGQANLASRAASAAKRGLSKGMA